MSEDVLEIAEQWVGDVAATEAELTVEVHGERFFGGQAALEKAAEVRALREALADAGLPGDAVSLRGLRAHVSTGLFSRSSSAYYTLGVRIADLSRIADVFEAIVGAKQASLTQVRWIYEPDEAVIGEWLARCARRARVAAEALAGALGGQLRGVAFCRSSVLGRERLEGDVLHVHAFAAPQMRASRGLLSAELAGGAPGGEGAAELAPTRRMGVRVELGFRLATPDAATRAATQ